MEHSCSKPRRLEGAALPLENGEQGVDGALVGEDGPLGRWGLSRGAEEAPETHKPSALRRPLGRHELRPVPERLGKIEVTRRDAGQPLAHGGRTHGVAVGRHGHLGSVAHGGNSREDVSHVVDLAGQNVGRQRPLASSAVSTPRQTNREPRVCGTIPAENLRAPLDHARSERQILAAAHRADATEQYRIP